MIKTAVLVNNEFPLGQKGLFKTKEHSGHYTSATNSKMTNAKAMGSGGCTVLVNDYVES